ncbi:MAG: hypothetical protein KKD59_07350, partial [Acidobacteria bacterium]|nr:hypothetical protein [Acidobacteriota bacterium]
MKTGRIIKFIGDRHLFFKNLFYGGGVIVKESILLLDKAKQEVENAVKEGWIKIRKVKGIRKLEKFGLHK